MSGAIGVLPGKMELVSGGIEPETKQVMNNIREVLNANGLTFDDVFKCTVMLAHMFNWGAFNQIYVTFYAGEFSGELRGWSNFSSRVHPARFLSMPLTIRNAGDTPDQIAFWQAQSRHDGRQLRFLLLRRAPKSSGRRPLGWSTGCGRPVAPRLKLR
jgi:hypothetical protein